MRYAQRWLPIHYSQNFLRDPELVNKLLRKSSIDHKDTVLEIGPGKGIITSELIKIASQVISVEKDINLYESLKSRLGRWPNLKLVNSDFLAFELPKTPYRVFANIPFNITANIIRKLTNDHNFEEAYLIVQKEVARRFVGMSYDDKNQMVSVLLKPWFDISVFYEFKRTDFTPSPHVDSTMIRINRLTMPRVPHNLRDIYSDFIVYSFNRNRLSRMSFEDILKKFEKFRLFARKEEKTKVSVLAKQITKAQENIQKIHRTRKAKNWINSNYS